MDIGWMTVVFIAGYAFKSFGGVSAVWNWVVSKF